MSEGKDVKDRHGHQLRSMGPPSDEKDDIWSTDELLSELSCRGYCRLGFTQNAGRRSCGGSD